MKLFPCIEQTINRWESPQLPLYCFFYIFLLISGLLSVPVQAAQEMLPYGNVSAWFVIGGNVNGGIYGDWPGLAPGQLYQGRYLDYSIDFRDVMGEVAIRHLANNDLAAILPGHLYAPIGFL